MVCYLFLDHWIDEMCLPFCAHDDPILPKFKPRYDNVESNARLPLPIQNVSMLLSQRPA